MSRLSWMYTDEDGVPRCDECGQPLSRNLDEWAFGNRGTQYHPKCLDAIVAQEEEEQNASDMGP